LILTSNITSATNDTKHIIYFIWKHDWRWFPKNFYLIKIPMLYINFPTLLVLLSQKLLYSESGRENKQKNWVGKTERKIIVKEKQRCGWLSLCCFLVKKIFELLCGLLQLNFCLFMRVESMELVIETNFFSRM
jgi:hypothetical protein